jgi:hypothetical protein
MDLQRAINTALGESCGDLFSRKHRNLCVYSLFNPYITGVLRAAGSKPESEARWPG